MTGSLGHVAAWNRSPTGWVPSLFSGVFSPISEEFRPDFRGAESRMILAQLSDPHIVAAGKLFRCPMQGTAPDAERARLEFDTAPYLAHAPNATSLLALPPARFFQV